MVMTPAILSIPFFPLSKKQPETLSISGCFQISGVGDLAEYGTGVWHLCCRLAGVSARCIYRPANRCRSRRR